MAEDLRFFVALLIWLVGGSALGIGLNEVWPHGLGAIIGVLAAGVISILFYYLLPKKKE
jgi:hypothetical protein